MDAFLPGGQLERPLSWLGRARLPAHLRVLTATTPAAVLSPPRATRIRSRTACNRRAAPLPSIVGAGIEDPCAICPEICGVTRLEPYVDSSRGGTSGRRLIQPYLVVGVHCTVWFLYLHRCRSRGPAVQGATGSGRTWQRRSVATPPFFRPTRYPPSPTLPPAPRLRAARAHARALAHRISVCALSSEAPITPGIHGRRGVPPETRIEAPASWRTIDSARPSPSPASTRKTASAIPAHRFAHSADPSGRRVPPWGATRAAPILARPSTPASAPSSTHGYYPRRGLEPAARNPHPQQGLPATDAAPLSSIRRVGAGSEDPCAICPLWCYSTRAVRRLVD